MNRWAPMGLLAALAALSACGRPPPSETPSTRSQSTLVRGIGGEPETLDPRLAADNPSLELMVDLFEGLTTESADGSIVPGAAESWSVSADGLTWTFELRPDLRWSDGSPLEAAHFAQGLVEATADDSQAPNAGLLEPIESVEAPQDGSLVVRLSRPLPHLPSLLALPVAAPEPVVPLDPPEWPVSNGAYRLVNRQPGQRVILERNPRFHAIDRVAIERVEYLTTDDLSTELNLYRAGGLDVTSEVPNSRIEWIRANLPSELHVAPFLSTYGYVVNLARQPRSEARKALAMALDRRSLVEKVTGAGEREAYSWVPPGLVGYGRVSFAWEQSSHDARAVLAQEAWRSSGPNGGTRKSMTLCTDASSNHHRTAIALADQWKTTLGLDVEIRELEWKAYLAMREHPVACDLVRFGWSADFADPESFLALFETHHPQNVAGYSSREFDNLMSRSRRAFDPLQRAQLLQAAERVLLRDVPVIPLFHRVTKRLIKPHVQGVQDNALGHLPTRYLTLRN